MVFAVLALAIPAAVAQDRIVAASPGSSLTLDLYESPAAAQPVKTINVTEAGLPLAIQSKQPGFYQVAIAGKDYWVRGAKVRISRDTSANCGPIALASGQPTAATPGAGKNACN
ncbi:hypothetical protein CR105_07800 [Massilia eurypsychrophila]|uniref:SH3 domain-containing protein n=2 Tax=Massilia eurypsychrophila TaxID=1485217 RepID=A0A2G8TIT1_9BURK|nr:hypothetical protein CR105_07800 [Massilia eurypsychrophila]